MKPKAYVETSIVSYLTAVPSRDLVLAAHQQITRDWWAGRGAFDLYISQFVLDEAAAGDAEAAARRMEVLADTTILDVTDCAHIANARMRGTIEAICRAAGFAPPVICTPLELTQE